uniref:NADH:ubiquinone reductase (H(+)-translocating) n=1 Tax=Leucosolenia complicata TaxID=433461 RepID=A0A140CUS4_9METZ|nr:NADH dehydrogenase subunit 5 [Leucosolenia complicata]
MACACFFASAATLFFRGPRGGRRSSRGWVVAAVAGVAMTAGDRASARPTGGVAVDGAGTWDLGWTASGDAAIVLGMVAMVSCPVAAFAMGYLASDPRPRFFLFLLSFFAFCMALLAGADGFLSFFSAWEGVGLSSYLLVGFWSTRCRARGAALRAVASNAPGDAALLAGLLRLREETGAVRFSSAEVASPAVAACFCAAAACKSALLMAHPWLPEAMEGPTPVSALLHSATLVAAGAALLLRTPAEGRVVGMAASAWGAATSLSAARMAADRRDVKRMIACSTSSHLGLVAAAWGCGLAAPALFHLVAHAFFKAEMFLVAGWMIHRCGGEMHSGRIRAGGAAPALFAASASLAGWPLFSGGASKEAFFSAAAALDGPLAAAAMIAAAGSAATCCYAVHLTCALLFRR